MANWIRTTIEAENIKNLDIFTNNIIDFNKIIPEPVSEDECPSEYLFTEDNDEHIAQSETKPWFNWGKWRKDFWGVLYNADDAEIETNRNNMIVFDTKGAAPFKAIAYLSKQHPDITFTACSEDIDDNFPPIIQTTWKNGTMIAAATASFDWNSEKYGEMTPIDIIDTYNV